MAGWGDILLYCPVLTSEKEKGGKERRRERKGKKGGERKEERGERGREKEEERGGREGRERREGEVQHNYKAKGKPILDTGKLKCM